MAWSASPAEGSSAKTQSPDSSRSRSRWSDQRRITSRTKRGEPWDCCSSWAAKDWATGAPRISPASEPTCSLSKGSKAKARRSKPPQSWSPSPTTTKTSGTSSSWSVCSMRKRNSSLESSSAAAIPSTMIATGSWRASRRSTRHRAPRTRIRSASGGRAGTCSMGKFSIAPKRGSRRSSREPSSRSKRRAIKGVPSTASKIRSSKGATKP